MMIVECGDQYRVLTIDDCFEYDKDYYSQYGTYYVTSSLVEQAVVTAILNVTTEDKVVVDMITGNQEQDSSAIKTLLQNNAYQVTMFLSLQATLMRTLSLQSFMHRLLTLTKAQSKRFQSGLTMTANTAETLSLSLQKTM